MAFAPPAHAARGVRITRLMRKQTVVLMILGCWFISGPVHAQLVSIGVKGGIPLTDPIRYNDESRRYVVGPSIEFRLPLHLAVEVDALYSRIGRSYSVSTLSGTAGSIFAIRDRGNSWE